MHLPVSLSNSLPGSSVLIAFCAFVLVSSITPGPNNTMLLASGVNFGFRRTVPHLFGICVGMIFMLTVVGLGLGSAFTEFPWTWHVLRVAATIYLVWLAWKLATAGQLQDSDVARPMSFLRAAAFQWVNPKAWVMAVTAMATYTDERQYFLTVLVVGVAFAAVNLPSVSTWAGFGSALREWLAVPVRLKWFNITMAVLLVISLWPMLK